MIISSGEDERISDLISQLFVRNGLEKWGSAETVLILITAKEGSVTVEPSQKVERKFSEPAALQRIRHFRDSELRYRENAVERRIEAVVEILDPWFYVFEGVRSPTAEIILFPLAPLLGFMGGLILMVFTPWGELRVFARFLLCGFLGCFVAVTTAFLVRQPGGIATGMVCYSAVLGFVVSSLVGVLRPFWFTETVRGRKPGEKFTRRSLAEVKG